MITINNKYSINSPLNRYTRRLRGVSNQLLIILTLKKKPSKEKLNNTKIPFMEKYNLFEIY